MTDDHTNDDRLHDVALTGDQLTTVLMAIDSYVSESERYGHTYAEIGDEPAAHQSCCEYHLTGWQRDKEMRDLLYEQLARRQQIREILDNASPRQPQRDIRIDVAAIVERAEELTERGEQPALSAEQVQALDPALVWDTLQSSLDTAFWTAYDDARDRTIARLRQLTEENP